MTAVPFLLGLVLVGGDPSLAQGDVAVFVDGRILKVTDAVLVDDRIVLSLPGGGELSVPATRLDRVVHDEIPPPSEPEPQPVEVSCTASWDADPLPEGTPFRDEITTAAQDANLHPWLLAALVQAESGFNPNAVSRAGACGLTQLMPVAVVEHGVTDVWDPEQNLRAGATHLRRLLDRFDDLRLALAAYNAGAATVDRSGGIPPYRETRQFVRRIMAVFCPPPT